MGLFNSTVLDVAIGLIFVYLLLAILCTAANEWLAAVTEQRAKFLKKCLLQLLDDQPTKGDSSPNAFIAEFYKHPLLTGMMKGKKHPAYISSATFAAVVTDLLTAGSAAETVTADIGKAAESMPDGEVKKVVVALAHHAERGEISTQQALEDWFNDAMDRVTGWYKRRTQLWTVIVAAVLVIIANADTVQIARRLWVDPVLRAAVVEGAKARSQNPPAAISAGRKDDANATAATVTRTDNQGGEISPAERQLLGQLLGWRGVVQNNTWKDWGERGLGWLLTVLALSMGAPFWFDLLNKFMNIRSTGKSPAESAKTPKK